MKKIDGLLEIDKLGLSRPKWEFVKNASELKYIGEEDEYAGWTVRTCLDKGGNEFHLPHANWIKKEEVPQKIKELRKKLNQEATFVVYPSWEFIKGANIMFEIDRIIIEVVEGRIHKLLYGGSPDLVVIYSRTMPPIKLSSKGNEDLLSPSEYNSLLSLNEKIIGNKILQWSHTTKGKYLFHDLRELK
ncbi:hypothetical protein HZB88_01215 [archaeon]|nr:hypothetical protein [archaeon]